MIYNKIRFLEKSSKFCSFFITFNIDLNNLKVLILFDSSSFYLFEFNSINNINLKKLYNSLSF